MSTHRIREGWYRWELRDGHSQEYWTAYTVSVYRPTYDRMHVSVLLSIANGGGRVLQRFANPVALYSVVNVPQDGRPRIEGAFSRAMTQLTDLARTLRQISKLQQPNIKIIDTETGEAYDAHS